MIDVYADFTNIVEKFGITTNDARSNHENCFFEDGMNKTCEITCFKEIIDDTTYALAMSCSGPDDNVVYVWHDKILCDEEKSLAYSPICEDFDGSVWLRYFQISSYADFREKVIALLSGEDFDRTIIMTSEDFRSQFAITQESNPA